MDPTMTSDLLLMVESLGLPAALGVGLLAYVVKVIIPAQQKVFQKALSKEQETHMRLVEQLSASNEKAFNQFSTVLTEQSRQIERLAEAVNKLHGMFLAEDGSTRAVG